MLMEFLSAIKQTINGNLSKSLDVLIQEKTTEINSKVDTKASQASISTLQNIVNSIKVKTDTIVSGGNVKSVQRGMVSGTGLTEYFVNISPINKNKSLVILDGAFGFDSNRSIPIPVIGVLGDSSIAVRASMGVSSTNVKISWQVIEFF